MFEFVLKFCKCENVKRIIKDIISFCKIISVCYILFKVFILFIKMNWIINVIVKNGMWRIILIIKYIMIFFL